MASNDMNSWDDNADEELRRRWQQTFDDFEVQPRPSLRQRVLGQLPGGRRRGPMRWFVAMALLLLIGSGLVYRYRSSAPVPVAQEYSKTTSPSAPEVVTSRTSQQTKDTKPKRSTDPTVTDSDFRTTETTTYPHQSLKRQPPADDQPLPLIAERRSKKVRSNEPFRQHEPMRDGQNAAVAVAPSRAVQSRLDGNRPMLKSPVVSSVETGRRVGVNDPGAVTPGINRETGRQPVETARKGGAGNGEVGNQSSAIPLVTDGTVVDWSPRRPHSWTALPSQFPAISIPPMPSKTTESAAARPIHPYQWFVDINPSSSFQWMSATPMTTSHLSEVSAPAAFSPVTWAGQLSGGLRFRRWQTHLSIGAIRRWAYYTVNENRYHVAPNAADPHRLVRESYDVVENVVLPMIGVGLNRYQLLDRGRYSVELGGQVSYLPTLDQSLVGLHGGAGRRLPISKQLDGQLGLTVDYGVNRLLNEHRQLVIHPLIVGIRLRIQPRMK